MSEWSPASWREKPALQQPVYPCAGELESILHELSDLPPLVTQWEADALKAQLADAALGRRFLLQGGHCAESFNDCNAGTIADKLKILLQMSLVHGSNRPVIRVGRFSMQSHVRRTSKYETV